MDHTLHAPQVFPAGTTVGAYKKSNWPAGQGPPTAAVGSPDTTAVVAADGTLAFTGLSDVGYYAGATVGGVFRTVAFSPGQTARAVTGVGRVVAAGNLGAAYALNVQGNHDVLLTGTLNANNALTFTNLAAGSVVTVVVTQDATGNRTLTVAGSAVAVNPTPASVTVLRVYSPDGSAVYVDAPGVDPGIVGASALRTTNFSVVSGATPVVTFDTEAWDTHGFINLGASASRITIPAGRGGLYGLSAEWAWALNATGVRHAWIFKNATLSMIAGDSRAAINDTQAGQLYHEEVLVPGDYLEFVVKQTSGGNLNLAAAGDALGANRTRLTARRLGPAP